MFTASVETDAGTYRHGYHLGTQEDLARNIIEEIARGAPRMGTRIVTVALMKDGKIEDVYDGRDWVNDLPWEDV